MKNELFVVTEDETHYILKTFIGLFDREDWIKKIKKTALTKEEAVEHFIWACKQYGGGALIFI